MKDTIIGTVVTLVFGLYEIMLWAKYGHLMLPGAFPDKLYRDIGFTDKAVVQCDVHVVKARDSKILACRLRVREFEAEQFASCKSGSLRVSALPVCQSRAKKFWLLAQQFANF